MFVICGKEPVFTCHTGQFCSFLLFLNSLFPVVCCKTSDYLQVLLGAV